ncbi:ATP-binding protein [Xenophilus sp. Marseille-Q4582]|uniref:hybrid sensor histidine kinase/response regulator n=1 Tax=Xenophilus sp. Marseille-Q4582 TaxID=2866600 RepID=UPI00351D3988
MHHKGVSSAPSLEPNAADDAPQRIVKLRRDYNSWVARETLEDYALRFTPQRFRKWSEWRVANTAFGAASFLILEAVGATLLVQYGFVNAFWAILATGLIIFGAGLPISIYAARYGVDMDLLTRGAGFGYIGSTITSLIYASFTFIFFALEAAVMAYALELSLGIPPVWGYLVCAVVVIPLVTHGVSAISRLQLWTQPIWLLMLVLPFFYVLMRDPGAFAGVLHYIGDKEGSKDFSWHAFGAGLTVGIALITQMGEQADYLRFMPARTAATRGRWWAGVLAGGPGWVVLGVVKMLAGVLLAWLAISHMVPVERAVDPNQMYLAAYEYVFSDYGWAVAATALFVVISQLKINVTNAYAGSLAWSNFFSRITHSHPGRVVWVVFNTFIAFMLMEMNVFEALGDVLGLYANIAIAWMMAVVADLVVNKPLGLSPPGIEFKRAHLWDINPVGVGAMALASALSITAHLGVFGPMAQAFSALIALGTAFVTAPLIAWATKGRYYLARSEPEAHTLHFHPAAAAAAPAPAPGHALRLQTRRCVICERDYEGPDMAHCPAYQGDICSLCCTLDARCGDMCKPRAALSAQWSAALRWLLPRRVWPFLDTGLGHFLLLAIVIVPFLGAIFGVLYSQQVRGIDEFVATGTDSAVEYGELVGHHIHAALRSGFVKAYMALLLVAGIVAWWLVLAHQSRKVAQEESNRQTHLLMREIELHRQTDRALQASRQAAEAAQQSAEAANQAKSRYISAISHELRTPLNAILGYAQLMGEDASVPPHRQQAVAVIKRGGEHLLSLIEGTLDLAHIEAGKLTLQPRPLRFGDMLQELADMFELQASEKGLRFAFEPGEGLPEWVRADEKRVRQILINLLGNAIKFTARGQVTLRVAYAREFADIEIEDSGPGMRPDELAKIFEPFARAGSAAQAAPGAGLGLTMAKMLTDLMGGELQARSTAGVGSVFRVRLFLPRLHAAPVPPRRVEGAAPVQSAPRRGYEGRRRRVLVVDNEEADRELLVQLLAPLGFELRTAASGHDALDLLAAGLRPDAIFMDLAMPGIDGWETLRRARAMWKDASAHSAMPDVACAIVSANAFDKRLENDVGITPEDFFVKPVRHSELLDWLGRRLQLRWRDTPLAPSVTAPVPAPALSLPPAVALQALLDAAELGYPRGVMKQLDAIEAAHPECAGWTAARRVQARQFQFEALAELLRAALAASAEPSVP